MHQTRTQVSKKIPVPRKGTKYVARQRGDLQNSVSVVVAVRDMLKLARTAREVKEMIKQKALKINGREVKDLREAIRIFNLFEAGKHYVLTLNKIGKFVFEETKSKERICKIINKKILNEKKTQLNLHDGTNLISSQRANVQDTVYLDASGKITKHIPFEKGKECFIISGKYVGFEGKIESVENGKVVVNLKDKSPVLDKKSIIVI
jgi:small subunit ribosomal protein S4e